MLAGLHGPSTWSCLSCLGPYLDNADEGPPQCDGIRPKCSGCEELGFECVYVNPASSSNVIIGKEYLSELEARLKTVEQDIRALRSTKVESRRHPTSDDELGDGPVEPRDGSLSRTTSVRLAEVEVNSSEIHDGFDPENAADGMGAMSFSAEEDCGFFGMRATRVMELQKVNNFVQDHLQISHLPVTYPVQWHAQVGYCLVSGMASVREFLLTPPSSAFPSQYHLRLETRPRGKLLTRPIEPMSIYMHSHPRLSQEI